MVRYGLQTQLYSIRYRGAILNIKAQMNRGRDLIDVLPTRTLRTNCRHANLGHWNPDCIRNVESVHVTSDV